MKINFVGAGNVASSLGNLFSKAGHYVRYATPNPRDGQITISEACSEADVVCFAIPFTSMKQVLAENRDFLNGKVVIDITNAINIEDWSPLFLGQDSGGEQSARLLPKSRVVKAFNTIFADVMNADKQLFDDHRLTAFIASDDTEAAALVKGLADDAGFHGLVVGAMKNARHLEAMAHLNIAIAMGGRGTDAGFVYFQR